MVEITSFDDQAFRGKWFFGLFKKDMDYRITVRPSIGDSQTKVKMGNSAAGAKFCFKLQEAPDQFSIEPKCEYWWFPQGATGTYVFAKKDGYGLEYETKATGNVGSKKGTMTVDIVRSVRSSNISRFMFQQSHSNKKIT